MNWSDIGGILTGVLTVSAIIFGGLFGLQRANLVSLQTRADENSKAAADLRASREDIVKELADIRTKHAELHGENELLKRIASGAVDWTAITDLLDHHHKSAERHWVKMFDDLAGLTRVLREVAEEILAQREVLQRIADRLDAQTRAINDK